MSYFREWCIKKTIKAKMNFSKWITAFGKQNHPNDFDKNNQKIGPSHPMDD